MAYTTFTLPSGALVSVESNRAPPPARTGVAEAADDRISAAWSDGMQMVAELAQQTLDRLRKATSAAKQVSVEFGVNITGKTGLVVVEGTVAANLKVVITW